MFCNVNTSVFSDVQGIQALLSAAEMLKVQAPTISGAFIKLASGLVENYLSQTGSSQELDDAYSPLYEQANNAECASDSTIERFADALVASADGNFALDFYKIAYLAYNALSLYGALPTRVIQKLAKTEQLIGFSGNHSRIWSSSASSSQVPIPSDYSPLTSIQIDPNSPQIVIGEPPQYYSSAQQQIQPPKIYQNFDESTPSQYNTSSTKETVEKLTELAKYAFAAGQNDIAMSAMTAAIKELEKSK